MTTPLDLFHARTRRKVDDLTPKIAAAYLAGLTALLEMLRVEHALLSKQLYEEFIATVLTDANIAKAFAAYRASLIEAIGESMRFAARAIPNVTAAQVATMPNVLDLAVFRSMQELDRIAMTRLADEIRAMARAVFQRGGTAKEVADRLYRSIGLGPAQVADAETFQAGLAAAAEKPLTATEIERQVVRYSERRIAANVSNAARTAALNAVKRAHDLAWASAREMGMVPDGMSLFKIWRQIQRPTKRIEHIPMDGERVPFDSAYSNGQVIPGSTDFNCGCTSQIVMAMA